jgi:hypothetical protein
MRNQSITVALALACLSFAGLCGCAQDHPIASFGQDHLWMGLDADQGDLVLDKTFGENRLLVLTIGGLTEVHEVGKDCLKGCGLNVHIFHGNPSREVFACTWGEIEGDVILDYSRAAEGVFLITDCVIDPRQSDRDWSPFIETQLTIRPDGICDRSERLLLAPEKGSIGEWTDIFLHPDEYPEYAKRWEEPLRHLVNIAVDRPDEVLWALQDLMKENNDNVCASESLGIHIGLVSRIIELRQAAAFAVAARPDKPVRELVLDYDDFLPSAVCCGLIGFQMYAWDHCGSEDPDYKYNIKVVVYSGCSEATIRGLYPSVRDVVDYRYAEWKKAEAFLKENVSEMRSFDGMGDTVARYERILRQMETTDGAVKATANNNG